MFSSCSLEIPQALKFFPKLFTFYPIQFAQSSTLMYINWKVHCRLLGNTFVPILKLGVKRGASKGECSQCSIKIADGPMNMALSKKRKRKRSYECTHELINISQTVTWYLSSDTKKRASTTHLLLTQPYSLCKVSNSSAVPHTSLQWSGFGILHLLIFHYRTILTDLHTLLTYLILLHS
jgi:hypothetical protein